MCLHMTKVSISRWLFTSPCQAGTNSFITYTRFQCYVHRRHLGSSFDMPSFDMLYTDLAEIKMLPQRTLLRWNSNSVRSIKKSFCER